MARTMSASDAAYRAYVKIEYFDLHTGKPRAVGYGNRQSYYQEIVQGPYSTIGQARNGVKRILRHQYNSREYVETRNAQTIRDNANPNHFYYNNPRAIQDWYQEVTDMGVDAIQPSDWKRIP